MGKGTRQPIWGLTPNQRTGSRQQKCHITKVYPLVTSAEPWGWSVSGNFYFPQFYITLLNSERGQSGGGEGPDNPVAFLLCPEGLGKHG